MLSDSQHKSYADKTGYSIDAVLGRAPAVLGCETPEAAAIQSERDRKIVEQRAVEEEQRRRAKAFHRIEALPLTRADQDMVATRAYDKTPMLESIRAWAESNSSKPWIMLCGPVGRGKTVACAAWLAAVDKGHTAYVGARELERLSMSKFGDNEAAYKALFDVAALVIDDVGREDDLGRMQTALLDLVDMRRRGGLHTALATNFSRKAFCERYSDARLQSRLTECAQWFADVGEDMRRAK
jgi:DNA replication protein DnaC